VLVVIVIAKTALSAHRPALIGVVAVMMLLAAIFFSARRFAAMSRRVRSQETQRRQFMAEVTHELRTPLAAVQGRLEGMLDGVYERDDARISEVLESTRTLTRLVEDLHTLSSTETGILVLRRETVDAGALAREAARSYPNVVLRIENDLPPVDADPTRILQVLTNLLANATRHSSDVTIAVTRDGNRVVFTVADRGPGISAEELPKIFDRFYRGPASRGSGLGLTIAQQLARAHGGEMSASSRLGEGTTIRFTLTVAS
jgi:signal transduction histidine kinase